MRSPTQSTVAMCLAALCLAGSGCGGRQVVFVPPGTVTRLAEPVDARVFVADPANPGRWVRGENPTRIPAGYYLVPPPATRPTIAK